MGNAWVRDVTEAARALVRDRGTTLLGLAILAIAMAVATVTFAVVDAVALRPLPFQESARLVDIAKPSLVAGQLSLVPPMSYFAWHEQSVSLESMAAARLGARPSNHSQTPNRLYYTAGDGQDLSPLRA